MKNSKPLYQRVLLKMSGEALAGNGTTAIDAGVVDRLGREIGQAIELGVEVGVVVGGGNFFRGAALSKAGISRITGDHMGMLATLMNALALRDAFERAGLAARVLSAIPMSGVVEHFSQRNAVHYLQTKQIVLFAGGTGNPLVTTDSAASLRGIEIGADILLKATAVDGIYASDPTIDSNAERYTHLNYKEVLKRELGVMDLAAFCQCRDHQLPIRVFNINQENALINVLTDPAYGTLVDGKGT